MTYKTVKYTNADKTMICATNEDDSLVIIEPLSGELWKLAKAGSLGKVLPYIPPPPPSKEEVLAARRAAMHCSTVQFGLALIELGKLEILETAFYTNPRASIVWRKAPVLTRNGHILTALKTVLKDEEIDAIFDLAVTLTD